VAGSGNRIERLAIWKVFGLVEFHPVSSWPRTTGMEIN